MTAFLGAVGLILATVAWVALPLLPAIRELLRPTDVEPLGMVGRDNADIARFARHFREWLSATLPADGSRFVHVPATHDLEPLRALPPESTDRVVVLDQAVELDGGERFAQEVWARAEFAGGAGATYRAILGERSVSLGSRSLVVRWLHSVGVLTVGDGTHLYGRTSSEREIRLGRLVGFDRLGAPVVAVGTAAPAPMPPTPEGLTKVELGDTHDSQLTAHDFLRRARRLGGHLRIDADAEIPANMLVEGDLVVAGNLRLGDGTRVTGSVKAHGNLEVGRGVVVEGSLVSRGNLTVHAGAWVRGPIISEEELHLAAVTVGTPGAPTTVSARTAILGPGAVVCGHVVTESGGQTEA